VFPGYYRSLVRAGENGGNLARVLGRLAETAELDLRTAKRAAGYAFYPATLALIVLGMLWAGLSGVSRLLRVYGSFGGQGGGGSAAGVVEPARWIFLLVLVVCGGIAMLPMVGLGIFRRVGWTVPALARAWSWIAWHVPLVGRYERRRAVSQYAIAVGRLMEAGVPTREALDMAAGASGNTHLDGMARAAAGRVGEGGKLSLALAAADRRGELPGEFLWHVEAGEASGRLPEALARAAESLSVRSRSALSHLVKFVFPAGVVLVALAVGMLAYAIFGTVSTIQLQMSRAPWRTQEEVNWVKIVPRPLPPPRARPRRRLKKRPRRPSGRRPVRRPARPPVRRPAPPPVRE
jgi:type II secretory pathway component PulF